MSEKKESAKSKEEVKSGGTAEKKASKGETKQKTLVDFARGEQRRRAGGGVGSSQGEKKK